MARKGFSRLEILRWPSRFRRFQILEVFHPVRHVDPRGLRTSTCARQSKVEEITLASVPINASLGAKMPQTVTAGFATLDFEGVSLP
jgi:hypothetical protein